MRTSRTSLLAAVLFWAAAAAGAQSQPQALTWAVSELSGGGEWAVRFPQLLVQGWETLPDHILSDHEKAALRRSFVDSTLVSVEKETSRLKLDLDRRRLAGDLPSTEPAATQKSLADLEAKRLKALAGAPEAEPPKTLPFKPVWASGRENLPWVWGSRPDLLDRSRALYLVTGVVRNVGSYLAVDLELYSDLEKKVLSRWEGRFAPDEAPAKAAEAADQFRTFLLGRPWAGLRVASAVPGTQVFVLDQWHNLPWSSDELGPGELVLRVRNPGRPEENRTIELSSGLRTSLRLEDASAADTIVLETQPPGVSLYLDSRYLGPSPQTVDRPLATTRVRAQSPGWATAAWEIGPQTVSPSSMVMKVPEPLPSVPQAKDRFYLSLATFSFSLTGTAFLGAWWDEQSKVQSAYAAGGASRENYQKAYDRYWWTGAAYATGISLTTGVFVWMMFELGEYLGAAQASLP